MKQIVKNIVPYGLMKNYLINKENSCLPKKNCDEPDVYNSMGEKMRTFYLKDHSCRFSYSFTAGRTSKYILWDRDNVLLPIHFYTHQDMYRPKNTAKKRFGLLMEPEVMIPNVYDTLYKKPEIMQQYDGVFTQSEKLLNMYPNTHLYLGQGSWYGTKIGGGILDDKAYEHKSKNISMVSSNKAMLESHRLRIAIAKEMKKNPNVDTYGAFDGGRSIQAAEALQDYRFSIVLENEISSYYFTEKILNCFASMTIPIYAGAQKINEFFNEAGIITINKYDSIEKINEIVNKCCKELYEERIEAVKDNYRRVQNMLALDDYIFNKYKEFFDV